MAQLHRDPRRPGHWHAQLWWPAGLHIVLHIYWRGDGHHDIRVIHLPLASKVYQNAGPGRLWRPLRPDFPGHHPAVGRYRQLRAAHYLCWAGSVSLSLLGSGEAVAYRPAVKLLCLIKGHLAHEDTFSVILPRGKYAGHGTTLVHIGLGYK